MRNESGPSLNTRVVGVSIAADVYRALVDPLFIAVMQDGQMNLSLIILLGDICLCIPSKLIRVFIVGLFCIRPQGYYYVGLQVIFSPILNNLLTTRKKVPLQPARKIE